MRQSTHQLTVKTRGKGLYPFTDQVKNWAASQQVEIGLLTLFLQHTSASLLIQENFDPEVRTDLEAFFSRLIPDGDPLFEHTTEGPDDMPAHVRSALMQTHLAIPIQGGVLTLGTWQGIYLYEHRIAPQQRTVVMHLLGTPRD